MCILLPATFVSLLNILNSQHRSCLARRRDSAPKPNHHDTKSSPHLLHQARRGHLKIRMKGRLGVSCGASSHRQDVADHAMQWLGWSSVTLSNQLPS